MDARVGHQVGLELSQVHIQSTIKAKRGGDGRDDLSNETVEVGVSGSLDVQAATTDIVESLIVDHESSIRVLQSSVGGEDGVVWLNNSSGNLGSWVDTEL